MTKQKEMKEKKDSAGTGRRDALKMSVVAGVGAAAAYFGTPALKTAQAATAKRHSAEVPPGELDAYYGF